MYDDDDDDDEASTPMGSVLNTWPIAMHQIAGAHIYLCFALHRNGSAQ